MPEVISLEDIRKRDADAGSTWFKEPPLGACGRAFIDRRFLLKHIDQLPQQEAYNRGFAMGSGDEGAYQREIRRLRTALNFILGAAVPLGSDSGHHGIEMMARAALDGSFVEPKTSAGPMPDWLPTSKQRSEFESWAASNGFPTNRYPLEPETYSAPSAHCAWVAWQHCMAMRPVATSGDIRYWTGFIDASKVLEASGPEQVWRMAKSYATSIDLEVRRAVEPSDSETDHPFRKRVVMLETAGPTNLPRLEITFRTVTDMHAAADFLRALGREPC